MKAFLIVTYDIDMEFAKKVLHLNSDCIEIINKRIVFSDYKGAEGVGFISPINDFNSVKRKPNRDLAAYKLEFQDSAD